MEKPDWFRQHEEEDTKRFNAIEARLAQVPTKADIEEAVKEALFDFFKSSGMFTKNFVLTLAALLVAIGVITGGLKSFLALLGFVKM